jgi:hypothetical protein
MTDPEKGLLIHVEADGEMVFSGSSLANLTAFMCKAGRDHAEAAVSVLEQLGAMGRKVIELQDIVHKLYAGPRCCGHKWINKVGRLYMHHGLSDDCPMHGRAPEGADRGLRCYINQDEEEYVLTAAANFELWKLRKSELQKLKSQQDSLAHRLNNLANGRGGW